MARPLLFLGFPARRETLVLQGPRATRETPATLALTGRIQRFPAPQDRQAQMVRRGLRATKASKVYRAYKGYRVQQERGF